MWNICNHIPDDNMSGHLETEPMTATADTTPAASTTSGVSLADARFIDLVTFRRTGEPVGTPVLFAIDGGRLLVRTAHDAGKLKRLGHTARVEIAPCDQRGRRLGPVSTGQARILGSEAVAPALALLHAKHRIAGPLFTALRHLRGKGDVIIEVVLDGADPGAVSAPGKRCMPAAPALAALAILAFSIAGCASGAGAEPAATGPVRPTDAVETLIPAPAAAGALDIGSRTGLCAIFPRDRAAAALGEPVGAGSATHDTTFASASCHYEATGSDASITVWYHPGLTRAGWERSMVKIGMTAEMAVSGIGEAAYRREPTSAQPRVKLAAFQGDHDVWVIIARPGDIGSGTLDPTAEREARHLLAALG